MGGPETRGRPNVNRGARISWSLFGRERLKGYRTAGPDLRAGSVAGVLDIRDEVSDRRVAVDGTNGLSRDADRENQEETNPSQSCEQFVYIWSRTIC